VFVFIVCTTKPSEKRFFVAFMDIINIAAGLQNHELCAGLPFFPGIVPVFRFHSPIAAPADPSPPGWHSPF
jgi:hypothetical protein